MPVINRQVVERTNKPEIILVNGRKTRVYIEISLDLNAGGGMMAPIKNPNASILEMWIDCETGKSIRSKQTKLWKEFDDASN